ncbi:MAG: helix-turn-helix transcriptional regulator [Mycobacteriales bacterium]
MKFGAPVQLAATAVRRPAAHRTAMQPGDPRGESDGPTRDAVARLLLEHGPQTAATVSARLDLSCTAIRRHLDTLVADGVVIAREQLPLAGRGRGRGRPARVFALTERGREMFPHAYDDLAVDALRFLAAAGGGQAVAAFAEQRVAALESRHRDRLAAEQTRPQRVATVAAILSDEGFAASAQSVGSGEQLCQHHCPVAHVAAEFPELCAAETRALSRLLGTHVQRLATIAHGDGVCTTFVPRATATSTTSHPSVVPEPSTPTGRKHI